MTTIAYNHKDKELAVDSQATSGDVVISTTIKKLFRIHGGWVAFCGDYSCIEEFLWAVEGEAEDLGRITGEVGGIVMYDDGRVYDLYVNPLGRLSKLKINSNFANGTGRSIAIGAMYMGATATQAVKAAIKYDLCSGGRIISKKMGDLK